MLGPGLAELLSHLLTDKLNQKDKEILNELVYGRDFYEVEDLK